MAQGIETVSSLNLAFLGDAVYELYIRKYYVTSMDGPVHKLNKHTTEFSKAVTQAFIVDAMCAGDPLEDGSTIALTDEELAVFKRGRNAKSVSVPKSCTPSQYRRATGFESLMGWLYLNGREDRIKELLEYGIKKYTESKQ